MKSIVVVFLLLLGTWGAFASHSLVRASRPWSCRSWLFLASVVLLVCSGWGGGAALAVGRFASWMLLPLGVSYVLMLPLPCYFSWITATRSRRILRNLLFSVFAVLCFAFGLEIIPLSAIGL